MTRDLGTHHVVVRFADGRGYIQRWGTGGRFVPGGTESLTPLAEHNQYGPTFWQPPAYESEDDLVSSIVYSYTEGNYSCDCNRLLFIRRAAQEHDEDVECGHQIELASLELIRPDGSSQLIWPEAME